MVIIPKRKFNKEITKAYLEGYGIGIEDGELNCLCKIYTPNQIKKAIIRGQRKDKNESSIL